MSPKKKKYKSWIFCFGSKQYNYNKMLECACIFNRVNSNTKMMFVISMVNLISIHLAQLVYACICREAVSTIMWVHNVLRGGLVILRLTLLSFFIQEIKINILPIKEWYEECYFIALMFKVFNKYMFSCLLLIAKW